MDVKRGEEVKNEGKGGRDGGGRDGERAKGGKRG